MRETAPLDFWFDYSSPYSYLLAEQIEALASRFGRRVRWRPILLGPVFQATGSAPLTMQYPPKAAYALRDFARSARFLGLPYRQPDNFPQATQYAARATYWLQENAADRATPFALDCFRALFVHNADLSALPTVLEIAAKHGVDREILAAAVQGQALKSRLRAACEEALILGVFGAPYVLVDGEAFFGADRLPQLERWLESGGF